MNSRLIVLPAAALLTLGSLAGCTINVGGGSDPAGPGSNSPQSGATPSAVARAGGATAAPGSAARTDNTAMLAAIGTASKAFGGGTLSSVEDDYRGTMWEVRVIDADGSERKVHTAADGASITRAVEAHPVDADDAAQNRGQVGAVRLGLADAVERLERTVPGVLDDVELDDEHGRVVWSATVHAADGQREVRIDAGSGDLVSNELDD